MPEPSTAGGILGIKYASLIAGLAGGIVSLSYLRDLSKWQAALAVITGASVAGYMTPVAAHFLGGMPVEVESSLAFVVGLTSMNIVPGIMRLSEIFKKDPERFIGGSRRRDDDYRDYRSSSKERDRRDDLREELRDRRQSARRNERDHSSDFPTINPDMRRGKDGVD